MIAPEVMVLRDKGCQYIEIDSFNRPKIKFNIDLQKLNREYSIVIIPQSEHSN